MSAGRPKKVIDKKQFENLCGLQCTIIEICDFFECDDKLINRWCKQTYGKNFAEVFRQKRGAGRISLRRSQFQQSQTNPAMAIWLGKQMLNQSDKPEQENDDESAKGYNSLPARVIGRAYVDINRSIDNREYVNYDFKGGRGSLKSSYCALKLIDLLMSNDEFCALAIRQVKDTMKDSIYSQIVWAIDELELTDEFRCTKNPMEIKRKKTGQIIYFRGADDPMKIKSLKPPKGKFIGCIWIEEADQLHGEEALRNILQSAMRGGDDCVVFRSYNTPISQMHFINKEALIVNPARIIHHSYYYDAPPEWLGKPFFDMAVNIKETNERVYRHEYLGEATGTGANVFENVKTRIITDEEINRFDKIYCGLDFGYYPDPAAFVACYYHSARRALYIFEELKRFKTGNAELAKLLEKWIQTKIVADSAEPKSIDDLRKAGLIVYGAKKGAGSVEYGMKWLASLNAIVIDNNRCPEAANEFLSYEYERTKDGEIISGYPDRNNHFIDAVRYALEEVGKFGIRFS